MAAEVAPGHLDAMRERRLGDQADQERVLEIEILRFAHFNWDVITDLARAR